MNSIKLTDFQKDALKEMAEIGGAKATDALSKLVKKKIVLSLASINVAFVEEIPELIVGPKRLIVGIYSPIKGDVKGTQLLVFLKNNAIDLTDLLRKRKKHSKKINKKDWVLLQEVGNILAGSYLAAINQMVGLKAVHEKPRIISTFGESIVDFVLLGVEKRSKSAMILRTDFTIAKTKIKGELIFLIALKNADQLIKAFR